MGLTSDLLRVPGTGVIAEGTPVLVTGASGFVGGHLTRRLLALGARVTLLVRKTSSTVTIEDFCRNGAQIVHGDLRSEAAIDEAVRGQRFVFHIAALFREAKFPDEEFFEVNARGTERIVDAARKHGIKRVVHCSTNGVHGGSYSGAVNEDAPFQPGDAYQESKCEAERIIEKKLLEGGIEIAIIRPGMIWGEGDRRFQKLFRGVSRGHLPIIGSGKTLTHWTYIEDLVESFLLAATVPEANGRAYLIAGEHPVPLRQVYETIAKLAGVRVIPFRVPALPLQLVGSALEALLRPCGIEPPLHRRRVDFFVKNRAFDTARAKRELGFRPKYPFEEEARRIYAWSLAHGWL